MSVSNAQSFGHTGGSVALSDSVVQSGEIAGEANIAVAANATNQQEAVAFSHTNLRQIYIKSDVTLTLKTNSTSSPDNTITITAGVPFVWNYQSGITNPFSAAVATCYFTNATAGAANLYLRWLVS